MATSGPGTFPALLEETLEVICIKDISNNFMII
jgi:hypothetical protein